MREKGPPARCAASRRDGETGAIALIPLLLILALVVVVLLVASGKMENPLSKLPGQASKEATVSLQKDYQNPFDKKNQYVNPFSSYKNPFDALK